MTKRRTEPIHGRKCAHCKGAIGSHKDPRAKYCKTACKELAKQKRARVKPVEQYVAEAAADSEIVGGRRGAAFRMMGELGHFQLIHESKMSQAVSAEIVGCTLATTSRCMSAWYLEQSRAKDVAEWQMDDVYASMLPTVQIAKLRSLDPTDVAVEPLISECLDAFWRFEHEFVTIGSMQISFIVKDFHIESIDAIFRAFLWGGRALILTPPRHGKSEMVLRFIAWIIVMYPNIQVLWVAANKELAEGMTTKLKGIFEHTRALREAFLPPSKKFGDDAAPRWRSNSFTLYTRTDHTLTSPTFVGLGSSATIAGRNADFIGIDDLEERKTVETSELRGKSRRKHSEIMERQEDHTGVVNIGSRQHPDDIPNHLIDQEGAEAWNVLVFPAHDEIGCTHDPEIYSEHVDCMLMPEIRPYSWLMARESETLALGLPGRFPLRYLQKSVPVEGVIFDIPLIREKCLDRSRGLGMGELPAMRLIAGLDPASRGVQASFAWGWDGRTLHMIDLEAIQAGGVLGANKVMSDWDDNWDLKLWFHEDNSGQIDAWKQVEVLQDTIAERNLIVKPHTTGSNKHDAESGISSMASWYHAGRISLPYGTPSARRKTNMLLRQLELWTSDGIAKRGKTDIKIAHWFPFTTVQKWAKESTDPIKLVLMSDQSYPTLDSNQPSWGSTPYPGA